METAEPSQGSKPDAVRSGTTKLRQDLLYPRRPVSATSFFPGNAGAVPPDVVGEGAVAAAKAGCPGDMAGPVSGVTGRRKSGWHHEGYEGHEGNAGSETSGMRLRRILSGCAPSALLRALRGALSGDLGHGRRARRSRPTGPAQPRCHRARRRAPGSRGRRRRTFRARLRWPRSGRQNF